tara:strand:- start:4035 stop:4190 length:156 start_codon:yes stop_codon:yes gene_type:complete
MKFGTVGMASLAALACAVPVLSGPALAQSSVLERLAAMEKRIKYLESRVAS